GEVRQRRVVQDRDVLLGAVAELVGRDNIVEDLVTVVTGASLRQDRRLLVVRERHLEGTVVERQRSSVAGDGVPLEVVLERGGAGTSYHLVVHQAIIIKALVPFDVDREGIAVRRHRTSPGG